MQTSTSLLEKLIQQAIPRFLVSAIVGLVSAMVTLGAYSLFQFASIERALSVSAAIGAIIFVALFVSLRFPEETLSVEPPKSFTIPKRMPKRTANPDAT